MKIRIAALLALLLPGLLLASPKVQAIRHSTADGKTRVVLDLDRSGAYEISTRKGPERLVIDLAGGGFNCNTDPLPVADGRLKRVRCNRLTRGAQIVLDLEGAHEYKVFALDAIPGKKPFRIVVDVLPALRGGGLALEPSPYDRDLVVVIDPGHGGQDPGARRGDLVEKKIVLDIAKRMQRILESTPGYRAELTRERDETVSLYQRRDKAEDSGGDLFMSIHCNSAPHSSARGVEFFYLSLRGASNRKSQVLADKENRAARLGGVLGGNGKEGVELVLNERMRTLLQRSYVLANEAHLTAKKTPGLKSRGVKRANFAVCKNLDMPSILVETGFLSNGQDRQLLGSEAGRQKYAEFLVSAAQAYFKKNKSSLDDPLFSDRDKLVYKVRRGDNLTRIAQRFGVEMSELAEVNHLNPQDPLRSGQRLVVLADERALTHIVKKGEHLTGIAKRYGSNLEELMRLNGIRHENRIFVGQALQVRTGPTGRIMHKVRRGENLSLIAERYGVSLKSIMRANGLKAPNHIVEGQELLVQESPGG
jgi:N-acetylmuramoyl-L-alanine amidase